MGVCSFISFSGSTAILMGKLPKLISFSIHPFFIGFGIHDVLRSFVPSVLRTSSQREEF
jgi:hypothetical protein